MWIYSSVADHHLINPEADTKSLGSGKGFHFLSDNPRIFYIPEMCPYCRCKCEVLAESDDWERVPLDDYNTVGQLYVCQTCGWWTIPVLSFHEETDNESMSASAGQVRGELAVFDTTAEDLDLDDLRRYIIANYDKRGSISPYRIEDAVARVFASSGYEVIPTPRSWDKGVDLFVAQKDKGVLKAVQVKRTKRKIGAELIRSFAGALVYAGLTNGVFVTTSQYTVDARNTTDFYGSFRGMSIQLVDAPGLFEMMGIALRPAYESENDGNAPWYPVWTQKRNVAHTGLRQDYRIIV